MIGNKKPTNTRTGKQFLLHQLHHVTPIKKHLTASLKWGKGGTVITTRGKYVTHMFRNGYSSHYYLITMPLQLICFVIFLFQLNIAILRTEWYGL